MTTTPRGAPELVSAQALPEATVNEQARHTEAGACHFPVADKDLAAPPVACADGVNYIIAGSPTGLWSGKAGQIATAVGTNAASGWLFHVPIEGFTAYVHDENARYLYGGSSWGLDTTGGPTLDTDGTMAANSDAVAPSQKAVRTYVAAAVAAAGGRWKDPVRAATTANGTLASAFENGDTIDGVVLVSGDRILLKNQTSGAENGIYIVNASGAPTRAIDADSGTELVNAAVLVSEGTANADKLFVCTTNAPITVGSTALVFANPFAGLGGGDLLSANNLSDLASAPTARTNLGLGSAAVLSTSDIDERARDALGTALTAGTGITITPNDGADTITIAASGGTAVMSVQDALYKAIAQANLSLANGGGTKFDAVINKGGFIIMVLAGLVNSTTYITGTTYTVPTGKIAVVVDIMADHRTANDSNQRARLNNTTQTKFLAAPNQNYATSDARTVTRADGGIAFLNTFNSSPLAFPASAAVAADVLRAEIASADTSTRAVFSAYVLAIIDASTHQLEPVT